MIIFLHAMVALSAVNSSQGAIDMAFYAIFLVDRQSPSSDNQVTVLENHQMVAHWKFKQLFVPLIIFHVLG